MKLQESLDEANQANLRILIEIKWQEDEINDNEKQREVPKIDLKNEK